MALDRKELISRHLDGELSPQEAENAERLLREDPSLAREAKTVKSLGALMRSDVSRVASKINFDRLANRIMAEAESRKPLTLWERIEEFFREKLGFASPLFLPGAVVAAAAVAAFLLARPQAPEKQSQSLGGPSNELVITKVDTDKNWMSQTIDDQGTTILWIDDSQ